MTRYLYLTISLRHGNKRHHPFKSKGDNHSISQRSLPKSRPAKPLSQTETRNHNLRTNYTAVSSSKCNGCMRAQVRRDFQGRGNVEAFSGTRVEAMDDGVQLTLRVPRPVRALRHVLAQQPVGILVATALPRALRIGKEDLDREPLCQALMLSPLIAPIIGQGFAPQRGHSVHPSPPSEPRAPGGWCAPPGCRPPSHCARP